MEFFAHHILTVVLFTPLAGAVLLQKRDPNRTFLLEFYLALTDLLFVLPMAATVRRNVARPAHPTVRRRASAALSHAARPQEVANHE